MLTTVSIARNTLPSRRSGEPLPISSRILSPVLVSLVRLIFGRVIRFRSVSPNLIPDLLDSGDS